MNIRWESWMIPFLFLLGAQVNISVKYQGYGKPLRWNQQPLVMFKMPYMDENDNLQSDCLSMET